MAISLPQNSTKTLPVLGSFSKGAEGSCSLSFCTSGGKFCDRRCPHHPQSTVPDATRACYAVRTERRPDRQQLRDKLACHERTDPALLVVRALLEVQKMVKTGQRPCWMRISTSGSVPNPSQASWAFLYGLRGLMALCNEHGIPVHFPIETAEKTAFYRDALQQLCVVRESLANEHQLLTAGGPVAFTAGRRDQTRVERVEECQRLAKARFHHTGRRTLICPAIKSRFWNHNQVDPRFKCGKCRACACRSLDILYCLH